MKHLNNRQSGTPARKPLARRLLSRQEPGTLVKCDVNLSRNPLTLLRKAAKALITNLPAPFLSALDTDQSYAFIVGCSHSGTTLLAAKLARSNEAFLVGRESRIFAPEKGLHRAKAVAEEWAYFAEYLNRHVILEKTPSHVHCVKRIWKILPGAKILAITRNPVDNIASLYRRFHRLSFCIERWTVDNIAISRIKDDPRVMVVKYEELVAHPEKGFENICRFLKLNYSSQILSCGSTPFSQYRSKRNQAVRTAQVTQAIKRRIDVWNESIDREQAFSLLRITADQSQRMGYPETAMEHWLPSLFAPSNGTADTPGCANPRTQGST